MQWMNLSIILLAGLASYGKHEEGYPVQDAPQLSTIGMVLDTFAHDCGRYPSSAEGLEALLKRPSSVPEAHWKGPYLDCDSIPFDRWGHAYIYCCPSRSTNKFDLYSR